MSQISFDIRRMLGAVGAAVCDVSGARQGHSFHSPTVRLDFKEWGCVKRQHEFKDHLWLRRRKCFPEFFQVAIQLQISAILLFKIPLLFLHLCQGGSIRKWHIVWIQTATKATARWRPTWLTSSFSSARACRPPAVAAFYLLPPSSRLLPLNPVNAAAISLLVSAFSNLQAATDAFV